MEKCDFLFKVNTANLKHTNHFLRALWANLRKDFSSFGWDFCPIKVGSKRKISIGSLYLGDEINLSIDLHYKTKETLRTVAFTQIAGSKVSASVFERIIEQSLKTNPTSYSWKVKVFNPSGSYQPISTSLFKLEPAKELYSQLHFTCDGFDKEDSISEAKIRLHNILNIIAGFTNSPVWQASKIKTIPNESYSPNISDFNECEFLEDVPLEDGKLILGEIASSLIDWCLTVDVNNIDTWLTSAFRHYNNGLQLEAPARFHGLSTAFENSRIFQPTSSFELVKVLYMSALEVVSLGAKNVAKKCKTCGQAKYKIRRRVLDLIKEYLGETLVSIFSDYYQHRSKYLHVGTLQTNLSYHRFSIPVLDPDAASGIQMQVTGLNINLREYVGYILRNAATKHENSVSRSR